LEVTRQVEKAIEDLKPGLKGVDHDPTIFRPATFIERSLDNLSEAMIVGCVLVIVILLVFLFDWRTAVISLTATALKKIEKIVAGYPALYQDVLTYLKERIKEVLTGATVVVRIFGPDIDVLRARAQEIASVMEPIQGVTSLKVDQQLLVPQVDVRLRPEASARLGLTAGDVRRSATTLVKGLKVGGLYRDQKILDAFVWGVEGVRDNISKLDDLPIAPPLGTHVPLSDAAEISLVPAPNGIKREGASRKIDVTFNIQGRDLGCVAREIEKKVRALDFEREYHPKFLGEYAAREECLAAV
jgi:Cu/Ag efflux pump CusA